MKSLKKNVSPLAVFNAINASKPFGETTDRIEIVGIIVQDGPEMPSQTGGDPQPTQQTFFFGADGSTYQSLASGVARAACSLVEIFGEADEWPPRLTVTRVESKSGKGNKVLSLEVGQIVDKA